MAERPLCVHLASAGLRFELKVGVGLECDWAFFDQGERLKAAGDEDDGAGLRRARIRSALNSELFEGLRFLQARFEVDF